MRSSLTGMRPTAGWLKEQDATILDSIKDPDYGPDALKLNPKSARRVMDLFLDETKTPSRD